MPNEALKKIRAQYPQYDSVDDSTLAAKMIEKYPQYSEILADVVAPKTQQAAYRPGYPNAPTFPMPRSPISQLGSDVVAPFKQYAKDFAGGVSRLASGDPFGGLQIGSGAAELAMGVVPNTLLSLAKQGSPEMAAGANIAEGVMGGVGNLVNKAVGYTPVGLGAGYLKDKGVISPQQEQDINRAQSNVAMIAGGALIPKAIGGAAARGKVRAFEKGNVAMERIAPSLSKEISRPKDYSRMAGYLAEEEIKVPTKVGRAHKGSVIEPSAVDQIATQKFPKIKQRIYSEQDAVIQRNANAPLVGGVNEIAANVESLKNIFTENIDLLKNKSILDEAAKYRAMGDITLSQARELQRALNANLQELYKKSAESQVATENMAKPIAEMEKAAESIREQIVNTLDANGEKGSWYRDKSLDYGAAVRLEAATERNVTRSRQPAPHLLAPNSASFYPSRAGMTRELGEQTIGRLHSVNKDAVAAMRNYKKSGLRAPGSAPPRNAPRFLLGQGTPQIENQYMGGMNNQPPYVHYGVPNNPTRGRLLNAPPTQFGDAMNNFVGQQPRALPPARGGENIPPQSPLPIPQPMSGEPRWGTQSELGRRLPTTGENNVPQNIRVAEQSPLFPKPTQPTGGIRQNTTQEYPRQTSNQLVTKADVDRAASSYTTAMSQYGGNNMATQRAEIFYREIKKQFDEQKKLRKKK